MSEQQPNNPPNIPATPPGPDYAKHFSDMAERIARNPNEFGGAYVVIGPDGTLVENAFFGPKANIAVFWGTAKTHISLEADAAAQAAEANARGAMAYGRR